MTARAGRTVIVSLERHVTRASMDGFEGGMQAYACENAGPLQAVDANAAAWGGGAVGEAAAGDLLKVRAGGRSRAASRTVWRRGGQPLIAGAHARSLAPQPSPRVRQCNVPA